jgi:hypothetical protein
MRYYETLKSDLEKFYAASGKFRILNNAEN